jgi:integrase
MRPRKKPRIVKWQGAFYLFYYDHNEGKAVRKSCVGLGATNSEGRKELLTRYRLSNAEDAVEIIRNRGVRTAYNTNFINSLKAYLKDVEERVKAKGDDITALGLRETSGAEIARTINWLVEWLQSTGHEKLTTGELGPNQLKAFFVYLSTTTSLHGKRPVKRSSATLNKHRRNVSGALGWIRDQRPKQFPDFEDLRAALRTQRVSAPQPNAFSPDDLCRFYSALREREQPGFIKTVKDKRRGDWEQPAQATCATPQSRVFLLLALTGLRLQEALMLEWKDVDLDLGRINITRRKTEGRWLPLAGAPEGDVSPGLLKLLGVWNAEAGGRRFVLPYDDLDDGANTEAKARANAQAPTFDRRTWERIGRELGLRRLTPQALRQNFVSYCASVGVPAAVAAMWVGHQTRVAEQYYRAQVLRRNQGTSLEAAMGLDQCIAEIENGIDEEAA